MKHILLTNDDGIHAPGLKILYQHSRKLGKTIIIAPEHDNSAASHSLTMNRPLRVRQLEEHFYAINGTPTDCVTIGINKILKQKPDLVISGINPGPNLGDDVSYSGTVSAAIEATMLGIPSVAISLAAESEPLHYETAAALIVSLANIILEKGLPKDTLLNVNVPNTTLESIGGVAFTRRGRRLYDDAIKETYDPWGRKHYWIGGGTPSFDAGEDTDSAAISVNKISITPMHLDPTNYDALTFLREEWAALFK
ncbi:MAG: stationary phase survival protein SurE [Desulfobacterales bacterium SG8_35_2]|jgi:5'-nucleotidase|nr:MAG: stationary phase survival protein SurE [Desulfobacterales bacterium SG8_35_2]